jgi:hypothetical protein
MELLSPIEAKDMLFKAYQRKTLVDIREHSLNTIRTFTSASIEKVGSNLIEIRFENEPFRIRYDNIESIRVHDGLITYHDEHEMVSIRLTVADLKNVLKQKQIPVTDENVAIFLSHASFNRIHDQLRLVGNDALKEMVSEILEVSRSL